MVDIGKLTPIAGLPWPSRHVQAPGDEPRRERRPKREPARSERRDDDAPPHIDEYA